MSAEWRQKHGIFFFFFPAQLRYVISFLTSLLRVVRWNAHRARDRNNIPLCQPSKGSWNSINITDSISRELDAVFRVSSWRSLCPNVRVGRRGCFNCVCTRKGKLFARAWKRARHSLLVVPKWTPFSVCGRMNERWAWNASFQTCVILFTARQRPRHRL